MLANFTHETHKKKKKKEKGGEREREGGGRLLQISMFLKRSDEGCKSLLIFHRAFQEAAFDVGEVM